MVHGLPERADQYPGVSNKEGSGQEKCNIQQSRRFSGNVLRDHDRSFLKLDADCFTSGHQEIKAKPEEWVEKSFVYRVVDPQVSSEERGYHD